MGLEDEARRVAAEIISQKAAVTEQEAREQEKRILEETPAPSAWTAELIAIIEVRHPDNPVYRALSSDIAYRKPRIITSTWYEEMGRGWGLRAYYTYGGWNNENRTAILLRDGNLYSGSSQDVTNSTIAKHWGLPSGIEVALVADKLLTHAGLTEHSWRGLYGIGAAAAILAGTVQSRDGVLTWFDSGLSP